MLEIKGAVPTLVFNVLHPNLAPSSLCLSQRQVGVVFGGGKRDGGTVEVGVGVEVREGENRKY
ncbi:MAG: hypothetical protein JSV09_10825 [Thermoplasmata archaeon]|nr:MAG: hypothetical protein JSV09_10825 [Thermoplasmata archaeon]